MREVIFENLKQYITPVEAAPSSDKKKKEKRAATLNGLSSETDISGSCSEAQIPVGM